MYLAKNGVLDALTKVLANMQQERPDDPLDFMHKHIAVSLKNEGIIKSLEERLNMANQEVSRLQKEVERLKHPQHSRIAYSHSKDK